MIPCFLELDAEISKRHICLMWEERSRRWPEWAAVTTDSIYYHRRHTHTERVWGVFEWRDPEVRVLNTSRRTTAAVCISTRKKQRAFGLTDKKKQHPIVSQWSDYKRQMSSTLTNSLLRQSLFRTCFSRWRKFFGVMTQSRYKTKYERHT